MALTIRFTFVEGTTADVIAVDASVSETHSYAAEVTEYPVEKGAGVTDNIRAKPITLRVEAFISDYPLTGAGRSQSSSGGTQGSQKPRKEDLASQQILAKLQKLQTQSTLMTVETGLREYQDMALENIEIPRDKSLKNGIRVTLSFKQVQVVKTQSSGLQVALNPKGYGRNKGGPQTSSKGDDALRGKYNRFKEQYNLGKDTGSSAVGASF